VHLIYFAHFWGDFFFPNFVSKKKGKQKKKNHHIGMSISAIRNFCNLMQPNLFTNNSYARKWGWNLGLTDWCSGWHSNSWKFWGWNIEVMGSKVTLSFSISLTPSNPCFIPNLSVDNILSQQKLEYKLFGETGYQFIQGLCCSHKTFDLI
jgi:hypothetical protein